MLDEDTILTKEFTNLRKPEYFKGGSYIHINKLFLLHVKLLEEKKTSAFTSIKPLKIVVLHARPTFPIRGRCCLLLFRFITMNFAYPFSMHSEMI